MKSRSVQGCTAVSYWILERDSRLTYRASPSLQDPVKTERRRNPIGAAELDRIQGLGGASIIVMRGWVAGELGLLNRVCSAVAEWE
jgi:hypothetical protein